MKNAKETNVLILCLSLIFSPSAVFAAPQGGKVVGGSANIHQSGATTTINQSSDRTIINWHSFDIGKNEAVRHNMPSRNSAGLHRVVGGGGASQIQGLLQSNGNVYLVNPAGVVIHKGARVDTNSFIATTRDIADSNFMKGHMVFDKPGRPDAQIINQGSISVRESGLAALVAPTVRNEGLIAGKLGKVALASGDTAWKLDMHGDDLITFTVDEKDVNGLRATDVTPLAGVENSGSIKAEGGVVVLTAAQLDGIVGSVVNSGEVSAASAEFKGGKITFRGQGSDVDIVNTGTVDASSVVADGGMVRMDTDGKTRSSGTIAATGGQKGGKMTLTGREVALASTSKIDVSGNTGGGTALVGGNALGKGSERNAQKATVERGAAIHADARAKGDGGQVVVWSDEKTSFDGSITAKGGNEGGDGGQVETSGKILKVGDAARVETLAPRGLYGRWLLDPVDFVIAASGGDMAGAQLSSNLASGNVEIKSSDGKVNGNGDIFVNDAVSWAANTTLTLTADRNVNVNANITATGANAGLTIMPQNGAFNLQGGKITLSGANPNLNIAGQSYTVINSIQALQAISNNLQGNFALGSNIDASSTASWNNGAGFDPIGNESSVYDDTSKMFKGIFNGLGNSISGLTINRPNENYVGLFGYIYDGAQVVNVGLENVNITGSRYVGALAGSNGFNVSTQGVQKQYSIINNSFSNGSVKGYQIVGGLVGKNYGEISHSSSYTDVTVENERGGGLVGSNSEVIYSSFSSGNVSGGYIVGGFVGDMMAPFGRSAYISNSYSTGNVSGIQVCGGFIGNISFDDAKILNSYSTGKVSGASSGGFAGNSYAQCSVINSYWDITNSGLNNGVGQVQQADQVGDGTIYWTLQGLTTEQLVQKKSYNGWDFNNIWSIVEGKNYPQLISVAVNSSGQSSTENVYQTPITPPTDPGTGGGTTEFDVDEYQRMIDEFLARTDNYQDQLSAREEEKRRKEEQENLVRSVYKRTEDYFHSVLSEEGSASALYTMVDSYARVNIRYLLVELLGKAVPTAASFIASGDWIGLTTDIFADINLAEKVINVLLGNKFLDASKECYEKAIEIQNRPSNRTKKELIAIAENLKNATEFGFIGMALSQDIFNTMKAESDRINEHPIWGTMQNIIKLGSDTALGLTSSIADIGIGFNKKVTNAEAFKVWGQPGMDSANRLKSLEAVNSLLSMQKIGDVLSGTSETLNTFIGADGFLDLLSNAQNNDYQDKASPKVQEYNTFINMLESLPDVPR